MIEYLVKNDTQIKDIICTIDGQTNAYEIGSGIMNIANFNIDAYINMYNDLILKAKNNKIINIENEYYKLKKVLVNLHPYFNIITYEVIQETIIKLFLRYLIKEHISLQRFDGNIEIKTKKQELITYREFAHNLSMLCLNSSEVDSFSLYQSFITPSESLLFAYFIDADICFFSNRKYDIHLKMIQASVKEWISCILEIDNPDFLNIEVKVRSLRYFNSSLGVYKPNLHEKNINVDDSQKEINRILPNGEICFSDFLPTDIENNSNLSEIVNTSKIYVAETIDEMLYFELSLMVENNKSIKKCDSCSDYFVINHGSKYCNSCKENNKGARKEHNKKTNNNPILLEYKTEYRRRYAEYNRGKTSITDFDKWDNEAKEYKEKTILGEMTLQEFIIKLKQ